MRRRAALPSPLLLIALVAPVSGVGCELGPPVAPGAAGRPGTAAVPVQLLIEPEAGATAVLDLVASARQSLWMEMYLLTDGDALDALEALATAGCDVRVILEPAPYEDATANQPAYAALAAAGADVRWATARFTYTHEKAFTVDHARLAVLTLNLTAAGLGENREYVAVDDDPTDVAAAEALFVADETGTPTGAPGGRLCSSPETSRPALSGLVADARASLDIETEELTDAGIVSALLDARARGVAVTFGWPGPVEGAGAAFAALAAAGATVRAVTAPPLHGKVAVADGRTVYLGSANLTPTSLDDNRELGVLLDDPAIAARIAATVEADAAGGASP